MSGVPITQLRDGIYLVDVVMRATDEQRVSLSTLRNLQFPLPNGRTVPLGQIASLDFEQEFPLIWRRDGVPTLTIQADVTPGASPEAVVAALAPAVAKLQAEPAAILSHRGRRHGRGKRAIAGLGLCRDPADAVHHRHLPDDAAAELQPPVPGAERGADGPDRGGGGAAAVPTSRSASSPFSAFCRCSA